MYCPRCGNQIEDYCIYCRYCGTQMAKQETVNNSQQPLQNQQFYQQPYQHFQPRQKTSGKLIMSGILLIFAIIFVILGPVMMSVDSRSTASVGSAIGTEADAFVLSLISLILINKSSKGRKKETVEVIIMIFSIVALIISIYMVLGFTMHLMGLIP